MPKPTSFGRQPPAKRRDVGLGRDARSAMVPQGQVHIQSTFNNTIVTVTDPQGNALAWTSTGVGWLQGLAQEHALCRADGSRSRLPSRRWTRACARRTCS